ncbi:unnamed protein product [Nippostrongylus brasiliensis]|uniref:CCHC-type domain-containing protein n=1 Tax=Nippostrongylus brasiliensis TaxID=27835 RepID=A0A0N4XTC5_NIPBR|nr:unnamed protein product [Nippostrongylus brasiliensis]
MSSSSSVSNSNANTVAYTGEPVAMERNSAETEDLAKELDCQIPDVTATVKAKITEVDKLETLLSNQRNDMENLRALNIQLQNQVDDLATRMANTIGPIGSEQQGRNLPVTARGMRNNVVNWSTVSLQLLSLNKENNSNVQTRRRESHPRNDGIPRRQKSTSSERSNLSSQPSSHASMIGESDFEAESSASAVSNAMSGMFNVFKEVFKAQSVADITKYDGKNSLSDFLRAIEVKYPQTVWSDRDRRDILVNHLIGSARSIYKGLPNHVKRGRFNDIVSALKAARNNPCEKLKLVSEWDNLAIRKGESVNDFCCRMEDISRKIHPSDSWDFHLASKLYSALQHWRDSYHMLAALDTHEGKAYQAVKKVALRLEKTYAMKYEKADFSGKPNNFGKSTRVENANPLDRKGKFRCNNCGKHGHFAADCRSKTFPRKEVAGENRKAPNRNSTSGNKPSRALSTFVDEYCGMVSQGIRPAQSENVVTGKPTLCDVSIFGMKVKALIDTGSVVSIVPTTLLKQAKDRGFDLDKEAEIVENDQKSRVFDASGNLMSFLAVINAEVRIHGAGIARTSLHVQKSVDNLLLLGTNALDALGVHLTFKRSDGLLRKEPRIEPAKATKRHIIPPGLTAVVEVGSEKECGERIFWSKDSRIKSGVCLLKEGNAEISVANRDCQTWVNGVMNLYKIRLYRPTCLIWVNTW